MGQLLNMKYKVALIADNHFLFTPEGNVYVNGTYTKQYLSRFTSNFDSLIVIARGRQVEPSDDLSKYRESGGRNVSFRFVDDFQGVQSYLFNRRRITKQIKKGIADVDAIFVRMPCILTTLSLKLANKAKMPVCIDVGADPETIYLGSNKTLFRKLLSRYLMNVCKRSCLQANGVSYVTRSILQNKYPCKAILEGESTRFFTASISNVDISCDFYCKRNYHNEYDFVKLLHISNIIPINSSKGHQESLLVLKKIQDKGYNAKLTFLGDGEGITELKVLASELGVLNSVEFKGRVADRIEYRNYLLGNDIFLFPSHSEGLPRVILEAMATGMACVSSNVDGIPEILSEEDIFDFSDIEGMANRIIELFSNENEIQRASDRNLVVSQRFSNEILKEVISIYYSKVKNLIDECGSFK